MINFPLLTLPPSFKDFGRLDTPSQKFREQFSIGELSLTLLSFNIGSNGAISNYSYHLFLRDLDKGTIIFV